MNADGWGVGFYPAERDAPARWRSSRPLWTDPSFASVAPVISAGRVLAAVRSATPGMPLDESATAPFVSGRWLISHNGVVDRARLNLLLADGQQIIASRWNDTLSILRREDGVVVASERYDDDPRWADVPDHHLVEVMGSEVTVTDLEV